MRLSTKRKKLCIAMAFLSSLSAGLPAFAAKNEKSESGYLLMDSNDVIDIKEDGAKLIFVSKNGQRTFDRERESWEISLNEKPYRGKDYYLQSRWESLKDYPLVPNRFFDSVYGTPVILSGGPVEGYYVFNLGNEGAEASGIGIASYFDSKWEELVKIGIWPDCRKLVVDDKNFWLGCEDGVLRVKRDTREVIQYRVEPYFGLISGMAKGDGFDYLTTWDGKLYSLNRETRELAEVPIPAETLLPRPISPILGEPLFRKAKLYIPVVNGFYGDLGDEQYETALLVYDIKAREWKSYQFERGFGLSRVLGDEKGVWCLGNWKRVYEGGDVAQFGGLAFLFDSGEMNVSAMASETIDLAGLAGMNMPVTGMKKTDSGAIFLQEAVSEWEHEPDGSKSGDEIVYLKLCEALFNKDQLTWMCSEPQKNKVNREGFRKGEPGWGYQVNLDGFTLFDVSYAHGYKVKSNEMKVENFGRWEFNPHVEGWVIEAGRE